MRSEKVVDEVRDSSGTQRKRTLTFESRYEATTSEDLEEFMCAVMTVIFRVTHRDCRSSL
jgi:hypothetical protein